MVETINKVIRVSRQLLQELGHDPSPEEIADEMSMPVDKVREILKIAQKIAGILCVFQDFLTQQDVKRLAQTASNACECRFLIQEILQLLTPAGMAELAQFEGTACGCAEYADPAGGKGAETSLRY
mgnify:CR=1 FL=1